MATSNSLRQLDLATAAQRRSRGDGTLPLAPSTWRGGRSDVLKPHLRTTIETLLARGVTQREIERRTGVDRKTIRK